MDWRLVLGSVALVGLVVTAYILAREQVRIGGLSRVQILVVAAVVSVVIYAMMSSPTSCDEERRGYEECMARAEAEYTANPRKWESERLIAEQRGVAVGMAIMAAAAFGIVTSRRGPS